MFVHDGDETREWVPVAAEDVCVDRAYNASAVVLRLVAGAYITRVPRTPYDEKRKTTCTVPGVHGAP